MPHNSLVQETICNDHSNLGGHPKAASQGHLKTGQL